MQDFRPRRGISQVAVLNEEYITHGNNLPIGITLAAPRSGVFERPPRRDCNGNPFFHAQPRAGPDIGPDAAVSRKELTIVTRPAFSRSLPLVLALLATLALSNGCTPWVIAVIESPVDAAFVDATSTTVSGHLTRMEPGDELHVNGIAVPIQPDLTWSVVVPLDTVAIVNPIEAIVSRGGVPLGAGHDDRIVVMAGPWVADGDPSPMGVALRFENAGLASVGPLVESLAGSAFDIGGLLAGQNPVVQGQEVLGLFTVDASIYEFDIGDIDLAVAAQAAGHTDVTVTIHDMIVGIDITGGLSCRLELTAATTTIVGSYDMVPDGADPTLVDVNQVGTPSIVLSALQSQFISGICDPDWPLLGDIINLFAGPMVEDLVTDGFTSSLADPDGAGPADSPIAQGIEDALAGISIAGEVGAAVGLTLDAPFYQIAEDADGLFLGADAAFLSMLGTGPGECQPPPGSPDLLASYDVPVTSTGFGATTPSGDPYHMGLSISASAFNQLLKASIECGQFQVELTEIEVFGSTVPLDSSLFTLIGLPFSPPLPPATPLTLRISPTFAPLVTANPGPGGELAELLLPQMLVEIVLPNPGGDPTPLLGVLLDARMGFDLAYDPASGALAPTLSPPAPQDVSATLTTNLIGADPASVESILATLFPQFIPTFGDTFGSFPLPTFFGLQLDVLDIEREGGVIKLYTDLLEVPQTRIESAQVVDLSPTDFVTDGVFDVREWRHRMKVSNTDTSLASHYQSVLAVDACCTTGDEEATVKAEYRVTFFVVPENGDDWQLDIDHSIKGALTLVDEANAIYDGAETAELTSNIHGRYSLDGGQTWVGFDFFPSANQVSDGFGGAEQDHSVEFVGSNGVTIFGSGPSSTFVIVDFDWTMHVLSNSNLVFPAIDGGEAAVRLGSHDTITLGTDPSPGFTAGDYPGLGGREISQDGHFLDVTLTPIPQ